ncbi:MAG: trypsin-like peptidase domain-containing protein [Planctomycetes bacterium]|nr:trypsin-like peptidase domain-containing protein [Planctomycetota bacterium]
MAVPITCLACNASYSVDDSKRGKKVYCRECKKPVAVPGEDGTIPTAPKPRVKTGTGESGERPALRSDDSNARSGGSAVLIVGGLVAMFVLFGVGLVALIAILVKQSSAPTTDEKPDPFVFNDLGKKKDADKAIKIPVKPIPKPNIDRKPDPPRDQKKKKTEPEPKPVVKDLPKEITPEITARVKQTTVYLKVTLPTGEISEGSGFFALERGIVITNAHVLGMSSPSNPPPESVEVVVRSGEAGELKTLGQVLGVDRASDLGVVRVKLAAPPPPLEMEIDAKTFQDQKVYVFGPPEPTQPGKSITANPTTVSSLRDNTNGVLDRIQVSEGMHLGNSGGPIVNTAGRLVGVCMRGADDAAVKPFAVPAEKVRHVIEGRFADAKFGEGFTQFGVARMPVRYVCFDPLNRIREMKVEVWAGAPGKSRPDSLKEPQALLGDSPRQSHAVTYQNGVGTADVPLPTLGVGQVYWLQPVLTNLNGDRYWGPALATPTSLVLLERKFANLSVNLKTNLERTISLKSLVNTTLRQGKEKKTSSEKLQAKMLESLSKEKEGAKIRTGFASLDIIGNENGKATRVNREVGLTLRKMAPTFTVDAANKRTARTDGSLNAKLSMELREEVKEKYSHLCNALEAVIIPLPNQIVKPLETWTAQIPLILRTGKNTEAVDLDLVCKFEGIRLRNQRSEALITVTGKVTAREGSVKKIGGEITGKIGFDLNAGFIAETKLNIRADLNDREGDAPASYGVNIDIDVDRQSGNSMNVQLPALPKTKDETDVVVKGGVLLNQVSALTPLDPFNRFRPGRRMKAYTVKLTAGGLYAINMRSGAFDSYLYLLAPNGQIIAQDDDGGGFPHAQIRYPIRVTGVYTILATSYSSNSFGPFQLTVHAVGAMPGLKGGIFPKQK